jgi:hypothetical protein
MEQKDLLMRDIERMGILVGKLVFLKAHEKKDELNHELNNGYKEEFDLLASEISLENHEVKSLLSSELTSPYFIKRLECFLDLLKVDIDFFGITESKKQVLVALLKKLIIIDSKNFSFERQNLLRKYE